MRESGHRERSNVKYLVVIEKGRNSWGAHVPELPGCVAAAKTKAEVVNLIGDAIEFHIAGLEDAGERVPLPHSEAIVVVARTA